MLAASKSATTDTKKSSIIFASALFIAILLTINMYLFFSKLNLDQRAVYIETTLLISLFSSVVVSLITVLKLGLKSKEGKYYLSLVIAMALWFSAESIWAYSQIILKIEMPYPSIGDFFWLLGYAFLSYHYYYSFNVWRQAKIVKLYSIIIAVIIAGILIGSLIYLSLQSSAEGQFDLVTIIVSVLYLVGNGVLLVPAIVIMWSLRKKDILLLHRVLLSVFVIINMLGDIGFTYHEILVEEDIFAQQEWIWPLIYTISYLVLITGLIWYNKISAAINNDIQITLNKRYPVVEELWNKIAASKSEHNYSANEQGFTEYFNDLNQVDQIIIDTLRDTHEEILILISTEETFLKIRNEIYQIMRIINELNIEARILIPESDKLQDLAAELNKYSKISFQRLYKSFNENSALFIVDSRAILDLEFGKDDNLSNSKKKFLLYSNKEGQVQSYIALFENCWMLPLIHEMVPNI